MGILILLTKDNDKVTVNMAMGYTSMNKLLLNGVARAVMGVEPNLDLKTKSYLYSFGYMYMYINVIL